MRQAGEGGQSPSSFESIDRMPSCSCRGARTVEIRGEPGFVPCVASDLDGTLIRSRPDRPGLLVVEKYEGRDIGFVTPNTWAALARLQSVAELIPATARVERQYRRLRFPRAPRYAVVEAGARLLVDGAVHVGWEALVRQVVARAAATQAEVAAQFANLDLAEPVRTGDVALVYAKLTAGSSDTEFAAWCADRDWTVTRQSERVYALPAGVDKAHAVAFAVESAAGQLVATAGDGRMDEGLLRVGPRAYTPIDGPLWVGGDRIGTPVPGTGTNSAEQIVTALLAAVEDSIAAINRGDWKPS